MSRTYRRVSFNKKQKAKMMQRYWQYHSEAKVTAFYEKKREEVSSDKDIYKPALPYRYHSDNYYSKDNRRKKSFIKVMENKIRTDSKRAIHNFTLELVDDVYLTASSKSVKRLID